MTGIMKINKLNKTGLYVSDLDWDECYKGSNNPEGNFIMIIEPMEGFDKGIIYYEKTGDGYWVEGEAYIIEDKADCIESAIRKWKRAYKKKPFDYVEKKIN